MTVKNSSALWDVRSPATRSGYTALVNPIRHVFLTGPKGIGKSTLIQTVLSRFCGKAGGFFTIKTDRYLEHFHTVHLIPTGEPLIPTEKNFLFVCQNTDDGIDARFDQLGCQALRQTAGCPLIIMDELGPHEAGAKRFHQMVLDTLDGPVPVFGDSTLIRKGMEKMNLFHMLHMPFSILLCLPESDFIH